MGSVKGPAKNLSQAVVFWVRRQTPRVKAFLIATAVIAVAIVIAMVIDDYDDLFVAAEAAQVLGISALVYKLTKVKTCAGLSLKSQELTAVFLGVRLLCGLRLEQNIHSTLAFITLMVTLWVIYTMRFPLKSTRSAGIDTLPYYTLCFPCALLAVFMHPATPYHVWYNTFWAFSFYLDTVSFVPQFLLLHKAKHVDSFTFHYFLALGISRFLSSYHWALVLVYKRNALFPEDFSNPHDWWALGVFVAEGFKSSIFAEFCYHYYKLCYLECLKDIFLLEEVPTK